MDEEVGTELLSFRAAKLISVISDRYILTGTYKID